MSSVELFAQAQQLRQAAEDIRVRARELARAVDEVQHAPGDGSNSLGHGTWAGPKASSNELLMHAAFDVLKYAAMLTSSDVEDLEFQARQLDNQAEQLQAQARQSAFAEAQARAEAEAAQRAALAAKSSAAPTAAPITAPSAQPSLPEPPSTPPALVYTQIETVPVTPPPPDTPANDGPQTTTYEDADFLY